MTASFTIDAARRDSYLSRESWLAARRLAIGASDAPGLWRQSKWIGPYGIWHSKLQEPGLYEQSVIQEIGHILEPYIAETFSKNTGIEVHDPGEYTIYTSKEWPFMSCTPDRLTADGTAVVELKTARFEAADEWKVRIPPSYQIQLQHQMAVLGLDKAYIAVLLNDRVHKHHTLNRSTAFINRHVAVCQQFWDEHVQPEVAPPADDLPSTSAALGKRFSEPTPETVLLPSELALLGAKWDELQSAIADAEKAKVGIGNQIKAFMKSAEHGACGDGTGFSWRKNHHGSRTFTRAAKLT